MMPSDRALQAALYAMSVQLYDCIGQGGLIGPSLYEYKRCRGGDLPQGHTLLQAYGLPQNKAGWCRLLNAYGFAGPTLGESKGAAYCRGHATPFKGLAAESDSYPEITGTLREVVREVPLEDGRTLRTTTRILSIR